MHSHLRALDDLWHDLQYNIHGLLLELYSLLMRASILLSQLGHEIMNEAGRVWVGMGTTGPGSGEA